MREKSRKLPRAPQLLVPSVAFMPTKKPAVDPFAAMESLRTALTEVGIVLPSLAVDVASPQLGLVELGRVRADVATRLAQALQRGGPQ
jgi:hypothetical protein